MTDIARDMQFGIFMAPFHKVGENPTLALRRDIELIEWADSLGYDEAWVGEHHSAGWELVGDPALMIAAAGERTKRIRLGSGVVSLPYHNPLIVADRYVQLDHLTQGRVMLGVGPGALVSDATMMGIDPVTQRPRMDEALGIIIRLLNGESVDHESDWLSLHGAQLQMRPYSRPCFPIAVASTRSPAGMTTAGRHGVGVLSLGAGLIGGKMDLKSHWEMAEQEAAAHGKTMDRREWRLVIRVHLAESREEAIQDVAAGREYERDRYFRKVSGIKNDFTIEDEIADDALVIGTPDDAIAALERIQEEAGGFGTFLIMVHEWANREKTMKSFELFARYVMPHFTGQLDPIRGSYDFVSSHKRDYAGSSIAALVRAYEEAGKEVPAELRPRD